MKKGSNKNFRTTIDGYYIHDARKAAKFAFEDFLLFVKYNAKNHCYDIFVRDKITENKVRKELCCILMVQINMSARLLA